MPLRRRAEHTQRGRAFADEFVDHRRDIELGLEVLLVAGEPRLEILPGIGEEIGGEAKEVHRHRRVLGQYFVGAAVVEDDPAVGHAFDLRALDHRGEVARSIHAADAARNGTVVRKGLVEVVGDHAVAVPALAQLRKVVPDGLVGFGTVEVVGIDHGEGFADGVRRHHHGVVGAPRLDAPFGNSSPLGQVVQLLEHELHGDAAAETLRGEDFAELLFERVADDENDLAETGADGVVDRIIYDGLVVGADPVHLLERTVTGAHTCGEDE